MKKFILLLLIFSIGGLNASSIDLDHLFRGKEWESVELRATDKPSNTYWSYLFKEKIATWICQGVLLTGEGYLLSPKGILENHEKLQLIWEDGKGNVYSLEPALIAEHPTADAAILKIRHPFGEEFPAPKLSFNKVKINEWVIVITHQPGENKTYLQLGKILDIVHCPDSGLTGIIGLTYSRHHFGSPVYNIRGEMVGYIDGLFSNNRLMSLKPLSSMNYWIKETLEMR